MASKYNFGSKWPELNFGIEEEFFICDADYNLAPKITTFIDSVPRSLYTNKIVYMEFHKSQIEINSGVCRDADDARYDLEYLRGNLLDTAKDNNLHLVGLGSHPSADWKKTVINPNYARNLARRKQFQAYLTSSMHLHFSISTDKRACQAINSLQYFMPLLIPISANSPYYVGKDTGYQDYRLKVVDKAHTDGKKVYAGIPPVQVTKKLDIEEWVRLKKSFNIPMYWDIRPNTKLGTIETRIFDVQPTISHAIALTQISQVIVGELLAKRLGFPFMERKDLISSRNSAAKKGMDGKYDGITVKEYWETSLWEHIRDNCANYGIDVKELDPISDIIFGKPNWAQKQLKIKTPKKIVQNFSKLFLK